MGFVSHARQPTDRHHATAPPSCNTAAERRRRQISHPKSSVVYLVLATLKFYVVPMVTNIVRIVPRYVMHLAMAAVLWVLVFSIVAGSFLGLALAVKGWAADPTVVNPSTAINAPAAP